MNKDHKMRILVTGHKGYIGGAVYETLKQRGYEIMGIDVSDEESGDILECLKEDEHGNFDEKYWNFQPTHVLHFACDPRVFYTVEEPVKTAYNNVMSTTVLLNFARKVGTERVVFSSSSSVVGNDGNPASPYALHKKMSEKECKMYSQLYGLDTVCLRYFNVYSECQSANGPYATVISNWMEHIRKGKNPFISGNGEQRRDMIHLSDIVSANFFAMKREGNFNGQWFDVGTRENLSLNEIKEMVNSYFPEVVFDYIPERPGDILTSKADVQNLDALGWAPKVKMKNGIRNCFERLQVEIKSPKEKKLSNLLRRIN